MRDKFPDKTFRRCYGRRRKLGLRYIFQALTRYFDIEQPYFTTRRMRSDKYIMVLYDATLTHSFGFCAPRHATAKKAEGVHNILIKALNVGLSTTHQPGVW